jgi:hypothetical protein
MSAAPITRSRAIAAMCKQCVYDPRAAGSGRQQVAICSSTECPLWRFRQLPNAAHPSIASRTPDGIPLALRASNPSEAISRFRGDSPICPQNSIVSDQELPLTSGGATTTQPLCECSPVRFADAVNAVVRA